MNLEPLKRLCNAGRGCGMSLIALFAIVGSLQADDKPRAERQWILVTTPQLREAAGRLVRQRESQGWSVTIVNCSSAGKDASQQPTKLAETLAQHCNAFKGTSCILLLGSWDKPGIAALQGIHGRMTGRRTDHGFGQPEKDGGVTVAV